VEGGEDWVEGDFPTRETALAQAIKREVEAAGHIQLEVYDSQGQKIT
jgi:hypothetical protein